MFSNGKIQGKKKKHLTHGASYRTFSQENTVKILSAIPMNIWLKVSIINKHNLNNYIFSHLHYRKLSPRKLGERTPCQDWDEVLLADRFGVAVYRFGGMSVVVSLPQKTHLELCSPSPSKGFHCISIAGAEVRRPRCRHALKHALMPVSRKSLLHCYTSGNENLCCC